jgi:glycosyltransferase involved in cell wall biosynthesis
MLPISVLVCTLNSQETILAVVKSLEACNISEIIIVDGKSNDATVALLQETTCRIIFDERKGLAAARNLGVSSARFDYVLFCGADNILNADLIQEMYRTLSSNSEIAGVGCLTRVERTGVLSKMLDIQWSSRVIAGKETVLGTPCIYDRDLLESFQFNNSRTWSDDQEICERIILETGKEFYVVNSACFEIGQSNIKRLYYRFKGYGRSDYEVYLANKKIWNLVRRFKSISHPFNKEFVQVFKRVKKADFIFVLPLLVFATIVRYSSWIKIVLRERVLPRH